MRITGETDAIRGQGALHYREGKANICPCCGSAQWIVGRVTAQCGLCDMPLPLKGITILSVVSRDAPPTFKVRASRTA